MGGLIGINSSWFKFRGVVNNQSYNDLTETGYYKIQNSVTDGPNIYWGTLVVFNDSEQLTQTFYPNTDSSDIIIRKAGKVSDIGKSSWRNISLTSI